MKKLAVILIATGGLLSGCVGYETSPSGSYGYSSQNYGAGPYYTSDGRAYYNRDGGTYYYPQQDRRDRDGDGVRNSQDRAPDNPYRR